MELNEFITLFAEQFDDTDASEITPTTVFRDLDEWSSLIQLAVLNMIEKKSGVKVKYTEIKECNTIIDIFNLIKNRQ